MHKSLPLVSVIIPTYNRSDIVSQAVRSALDQDYPAKQIIVVDDGSTDDTVKVLRKLSSIEVISQPNQGASAARNCGLSAAKGGYVATLDSDDCWHKDYLSYGMQRVQQYNVGIFFANWKEVGPQGQLDCADYFAKAKMMQPYLGMVNADGDVLLSPQQCRQLFLKGLAAPSSGLIMHRTLIANGWEQGLTMGEDWLMVLKAVLQQPIGCAFTMNRLWTKMRDGKNIYDLTVATPELQHKVAVDTETVANRVMNLLTPGEQKEFRSLVAEKYFDYAYSVSSSDPARAFSFFRKSNQLSFRGKTCAAMMKTLLKRGGRKSRVR
jgi:glycosyltransferase involved in cell wall biosynthesis